MAITALPTPPSRQDPTNFNDRADAFLGALPTFQTEANALQVNVNTSEANAVASAAAVLAATNIVKWVSGTTYANGAVVWSPINGLAYRRITTSGSGTTDPSADTTNYKQVNGTGDVSTSGDQTIAGTKTFSSTIVGNLTGTASNASQLNGQSASFYQTALGFSPVQQGTGTGQLANSVKIGWNGSALALEVDNTNFGAVWPIDANVSTTKVLSATAGSNVGAVGTYAFLGVPYGTFIVYGPGSTGAGSNLRYSGGNGFTQSGTPSGTWRCMGYAVYTSDGYGGYAIATPSLFLRIS